MALYPSVVSIGRMLPVFLALIAISAAISFTASTFIGIYETAVSLMGGGDEDVLVIYGASAKTPQTSVISLSLYDDLRVLEGVEAVGPEVVAAAMVEDRVLIVRGVDPELIHEISDIRLIEGSGLSDCPFSALAGRRLAKLLNLRVGDFITLRSAYSSQFLEVKIEGVYESGSYLDDELLVPVYSAQWLRGLPKDAVSLIRVKIDPSKLSKEDLILHLRGGKYVEERTSPISKSSIMRLLTVPRARRYAMEYEVAGPEESMRSFLEKEVRVNDVMVWSLVATVITGSALMLYLASSLIVVSHSREIEILRGLGASRRRLLFSVVVFTILLSVFLGAIGFVLGILLSETFSEAGLIMVGPYIAEPAFRLESFVMTVAVVASITAVAVRRELESVFRGEYRGM